MFDQTSQSREPLVGQYTSLGVLQEKTYLRYILLFFISFGIFALIAVLATPFLQNFAPFDFKHYLSASQLLLQRESPYGVVEYFAPPWCALLFAPFLFLPLPVASLFWVLLNLWAICISIYLSIRLLGLSFTGRTILFIVLAAAIMPAALFNYITGQVSPIVLMAVLLAGWSLIKQRSQTLLVTIGVLIATAKPHIVVFPVFIILLELVRRKDWRTLRWIGIGFLLLSIIAFWMDKNWPVEMVAAWLKADYRGGRPGLSADGYTGLIELGIPQWLFFVYGFYVLYLWWKHGFQTRVLIMSLPVGLLILPYFRSYDYIVLLLPILTLITRAPARNKFWFAVVGWVSYLLPLTPLSLLTPVLVLIGLLSRLFPAKAGSSVDLNRPIVVD
jgi:hypothetical protein